MCEEERKRGEATNYCERMKNRTIEIHTHKRPTLFSERSKTKKKLQAEQNKCIQNSFGNF